MDNIKATLPRPPGFQQVLTGMRIRLLFLFLVVLIFVATPATSKGQEGAFSRPYIRHYELNEGLPHRSVLSSAHDRNNIQWITTQTALCRDDGQQITAFSKFQQNFSGSIALNEDSLMYAIPQGYPDSVEILNPTLLTTSGRTLGNGLLGAYAGASHRDGAPLYFAKGSFIYRFHPENEAQIVHHLQAEVVPGDQLIDANEDSYLLLRPENNVLEEVHLGKQLTITLPADRDSVTIHAGKSGTIWLGTPDGLLKKQRGSQQLTNGPELPGGKTVNLIFEDKNNHLLFGNLHPNRLRVSTLVSYFNDTIRSLDWLAKIENRLINIAGDDFFQSIEYATHGGFYRINFPENQPTPFRKYLYDPEVTSGKFGHVMRGFTADNNGNVYTNKDTQQPYWFRVNQTDLSLDTLTMVDNSGKVIDNFGCGTNMLNLNGDIFGSSCVINLADTAHVYRYRPQTDEWTQWTLPDVNQRIRWMMSGRTNGELLLLTQGVRGEQGNLYYFTPADGTFSRILPAGPSYEFDSYPKTAVFDSTRQCVWIGTLSGLYKFQPETDSLHRYLMPAGYSTEIVDIMLREKGDLLLGTFKRGIQRFFPETSTFVFAGGVPEDGNPITQSSSFLPLPSNDIAAMAKTPENYLLITTFNGLSFHGPTGGTDGRFTRIDGLPSNEFNTTSLFYNDFDQRWYAGGINGFTSFLAEDLVRDTSPYDVVLLRTRFLDEEIGYEKMQPLHQHVDRQLEIAPTVAYFAIEFTIPDYSDKNPPRYQTKLDGLDNEWRSPETSPTVRYTQLAPGNYTLNIRATDRSGRPTGNPTQLKILVHKPWYKTNLFFGLVLLALIGLIVFYIKIRERMLLREQRNKRRVQELELKTLRQQLNPHFISNAMNAIRDFIYAEQPDEAASYLHDFTRLMRLFLEVSRSRFTTIKDEVELLERYIRLEQLRFRGKFDYAFEIDPELEQGMDEVPSLLLQPLVENAINHGLVPLESGGLLTVEILLDPSDDEVIICRVSDNGVGRKITAQRHKAPGDHISRATQILEERRVLLREEGNTNLLITTEDLHPDQQHTGTVVTIRIEPIDKLTPA